MNLVDDRGHRIAGSRTAPCEPEAYAGDALVARALAGEVASGTRLLSSAALRLEGAEPAENTPNGHRSRSIRVRSASCAAFRADQRAPQ